MGDLQSFVEKNKLVLLIVVLAVIALIYYYRSNKENLELPTITNLENGTNCIDDKQCNSQNCDKTQSVFGVGTCRQK